MVLMWEKPKQIMTEKERVRKYSADGAPPGAYMPNMSKEDARRFRAKLIGGRDPRVEIRTRKGSALVLIVVRNQKGVRMSMNGKSSWSPIEWKQLMWAVQEAYAELSPGKQED